MLFNSPVFILVFLPCALLGFGLAQRLSGRRAAIGWLLTASLVFYGWSGLPWLSILVGSLVFNYVALGAIERSEGHRRRLLVGVGVASNLAVLGYFKYANFFLDNINLLANTHWQIEKLALPIGISFFTFQQIAILVDAGARRAAMPGALEYGFFVAFFPQLIAGPIVRHDELIPQAEKATGRLSVANVAAGSTIFAVGLAKKMVIADSMGAIASPLFNAAGHGIPLDLVSSWIAVLAYTLQIYFDFSAYSDMAVGLGRMFGFQIPINFASPYKAISIEDFWRRWHITLSRFLRDYLYIPLGGNRRGSIRRVTNLMITMGLGGLWHGAGWTFLVWGLLHGAYIVCYRGWGAASARWLGGWSLPRWLAQAVTLACVMAAWVPFRADGMDATGLIWGAMLGWHGVMDSPLDFRVRTLPMASMALFWFIALFGPNTYEFMRKAQLGTATRGYPATLVDADSSTGFQWRPSPGFAIGCGLLLALSALHFFSLSEFIYFQF